MASNASRGAQAKWKTRKWLVGRGYQVANLEEIRWIFRPGQPRMPVKRDQFGADLLAMSETDIIFIQVKSGKATTGNFPAARRKFEEFIFPRQSKQWVVAWPVRARDPRIVDCTRPPLF